MANSYHKLLNCKLKTNYKDKFIESLHQELKTSVRNQDDDLYSMINSMSIRKKQDSLDINMLLKYYVLNQILESSKESTDVNNYIDTHNPKIKKDRDGIFYRVYDDSIEKDESIVSVGKDGGYVVREIKRNSSYVILKTFDINDKIMTIQIFDGADKLVTNKILVAELMGLRREYKSKYKYSGYSGYSNDMIAKLRNFLSAPIETGYYMDFHCVFYKWQASTSSFVRMVERDSDSPLLVDLEYCDNGTILRQEYTGIVA